MNATNNQPTFSASEGSVYQELPVRPAFVRWTRGNAELEPLKDTDPGRYYGGWRARVMNTLTNEVMPEIPLPKVKRSSADGKTKIDYFASNVIEFLPIQHRTRFELREEEQDPQTGAKRNVVKAIANQRTPGYQPHKQVFGLLFNGEQYAPAVLILDKWNTFITFNKAEDKFAKVRVPAGQALVRKYGTVGTKDDLPKFEEYGQSLSTPIEPIDIAHPRFIDITDEMTQLFYESVDWKDDPIWHRVGERTDDNADTLSAKSQFISKIKEMGLDYETDGVQILAENDGDYRNALKALESGFMLDEAMSNKANIAVEDAEETSLY